MPDTYRRRPCDVLAEQWQSGNKNGYVRYTGFDCRVMIRDDRDTAIHPGEWLVVYTDRPHPVVMSDEEFRATFDPIGGNP